MINLTTMCMGCMTGKVDGDACPQCGYVANSDNSPISLPECTLLKERFLVGRRLGRPGGFGITYLAWDKVLEAPLAIKEFFPTGVASRGEDGCTVVPNSAEDKDVFDRSLKDFLREARTVVKFPHPNIVRIRDFFIENGTAYLVMDYYYGKSLRDYANAIDGNLDEQQAMALIEPILDGLEAIHDKGFLHRDIKPPNIYITDAGVPILLDFGLAREVFSDATRSIVSAVSMGYAPIERYFRGGNQGPWTDIYGCAATLYYLVTSKSPPEALERQHSDTLIPAVRINNKLHPRFSDALTQSMSMDYRLRPATIAEFRDLLVGRTVATLDDDSSTQPIEKQALRSISEASPEAPHSSTETDADDVANGSMGRESSKRGMVWLYALILLVLLAVGAGIAYQEVINSSGSASNVVDVAESIPTRVEPGDQLNRDVKSIENRTGLLGTSDTRLSESRLVQDSPPARKIQWSGIRKTPAEPKLPNLPKKPAVESEPVSRPIHSADAKSPSGVPAGSQPNDRAARRTRTEQIQERMSDGGFEPVRRPPPRFNSADPFANRPPPPPPPFDRSEDERRLDPPRPPRPPQEAIDVCEGKRRGDSCQVMMPRGTLHGTCERLPGVSLGCRPQHERGRPPPR